MRDRYGRLTHCAWLLFPVRRGRFAQPGACSTLIRPKRCSLQGEQRRWQAQSHGAVGSTVITTAPSAMPHHEDSASFVPVHLAAVQKECFICGSSGRVAAGGPGRQRGEQVVLEEAWFGEAGRGLQARPAEMGHLIRQGGGQRKRSSLRGKKQKSVNQKAAGPGKRGPGEEQGIRSGARAGKWQMRASTRWGCRFGRINAFELEQPRHWA